MKKYHDIGLRAVKGLNILLITIPFALCWHLYYANYTAALFARNARTYVVLLYIILYTIFGRVYDAFLVSYYRITEMIYNQVLAFLVSDGLIYLVICLLCKKARSIVPGVFAIVGQAGLATIWTLLVHRWYFRHFAAKRTVVVYDTREGMENLIHEYGLGKKFKIDRIVRIEECLTNLSILDGAEDVFLSGIHSHERNTIIKYCTEHDITAMVIPRIGDVLMSSAKRMHLFHLPVLRVSRYNPKPEYLLAKRLFDVFISATALVILSPVMLITAFAIHATDKGPVFYRQTRLTKDRREFRILKFRSMRVDAEKDGVARLSTGDVDDRITPVGRFIRKVRIDELPQLINILKGDMTIVGPRPERPEIAEEYEREMPEFKLRLQAKAGLTGYAQVYGKYNTTPYDKLMMDLMYIAHPGIAEDLRIIFATVKILFLPESTEGISAGQTTAMAQDIVDCDNSDTIYRASKENDEETVKNN